MEALIMMVCLMAQAHFRRRHLLEKAGHMQETGIMVTGMVSEFQSGKVENHTADHMKTMLNLAMEYLHTQTNK